MRALIPLPAQVERFIRLPPHLIRPRRTGTASASCCWSTWSTLFLDRLFPGFRVLGHGLFRLIRDTDVEFEEEAEDLVRCYETALKRRRRGVAIHLSVDADMPDELRDAGRARSAGAPARKYMSSRRPARAGRPEAAHRR